MQTTLMFSFSVISVFIMLILGTVLYIRFSNVSRDEIVETTRKLMEQTGENLEDYLVSMRQISDAVYYNVVKESDFSRALPYTIIMEALWRRSRWLPRKKIPM